MMMMMMSGSVHGAFTLLLLLLLLCRRQTTMKTCPDRELRCVISEDSVRSRLPRGHEAT